jgi:hypothetical protein
MRLLAPLLLLVACAGSLASDPVDPHREVRGVTVSCQTWGREWGSDAMPAALDGIRAVGGNWVAIHPYARIGKDGSVRFRLPAAGEAPPGWLSRPIAWAHARKMKILVKPHLAYWGSGFGWRGEIAFAETKARARFFRDYEAWITRLLSFCAEADAFCVGTELGGTASHEAEWRRVIASSRRLYKGPLTYAANWDRYAKVGFWDALDVIGIQAYFPLVGHERRPTDAELAAGWKRVTTEVSGFAARHKKDVVFTELGYDCSPQAALRPWKPERSSQLRPAARDLQARCLKAALQAIAAEPKIVGSFLWKTFAGPAPREDFPCLRPGLLPLLRAAWQRGQKR